MLQQASHSTVTVKPCAGPLAGVRVLEMDALGPVPFCAMVLAGMGAEVVHVDRPGSTPKLDAPVRAVGRLSVPVDLKRPGGQNLVRRLAARADILIEGARPGVMERLGLGPDELHAVNERLVYGRMTGWGQSGPLAKTAGHDINYIALAGPLGAIGRRGEPPVPPLNLVGDYGGGAMFLLSGVLAAMIEVGRTGRGQVVDAAMVDGSALLMTLFFGWASAGLWSEERGQNLLDGGAPWYDTYPCADGRYVAVGALEEPFWRALLAGLEIDPASLPPRSDRAGWPTIREALARAFASRGRDEWAAHFAHSDACVTPVLTMSEAVRHPQALARDAFRRVGGTIQPAPSPRFERGAEPAPSRQVTAAEALAAWDA